MVLFEASTSSFASRISMLWVVQLYTPTVVCVDRVRQEGPIALFLIELSTIGTIDLS